MEDGPAGQREDLLGRDLQHAKQVATAVNAIRKGSRLMTPVGGGVKIEPTRALSPDKRLPDEEGNVAKARQQVKINLAKGQWWWD